METEIYKSNNNPAAARNRTQRAAPPRSPSVDIFENDQEVVMLADVAGSTPESVKLEVEQGVLRFTAEGAGSNWGRTFLIPRGFAVDGIQAALTCGVLRITLPKSPEIRRRTVEVKAG
jgi:HSP20 family protein